MGSLIHALDWPQTPLGPFESWPHALKLALNLCLNSPYPALIWWGPESIMLYNEACLPLLGTVRYRTALGQPGQEGWPENWPVLGPKVAEVLAKGEAIYAENQPLFLEHEGYFEEGYFTFSHTPLWEESGLIKGVFSTVLETAIQKEGQRETALPEDERQYHSLVERAPVFIWQADAQGNLIFYSKDFYLYTGLNPESLHGWEWKLQQVVHPDDLPETAARWQHSLATGVDYEMELRIRGADGVYRWHLNRGLPVRDREGQIISWAGTGTNIEQRKQAEEKLRERAEMLDLAPVLICDLENRITFWNQGAEQLYGFSQAEALGRTTQELFQTRFPQPLGKIEAKLLQTGNWQGELIHTRRDGTQIVVASHWVLHKDRAGQPLSVLRTNNDITQLKRTEAALRTAHQRNTYILNNMSDAFFILDRSWRYLFVNEAGLAQVRKPREALLGQKVWEIFPDLTGTEVQQGWERVLEEGAPASFEFYYPHYGAWFHHRVYPSLEGIAVFISDITERKSVEEALRLSEERFAKAFQLSPDPLAITRQTDGRILELNASFEKVFGYSRQEALGRSAVELNLYLEPADRQHIIEQLTTQGFLRDFELDLQTKSGEICHFTLSVEPVTLSGESCLLNVLHDITGQKQAQEALGRAKAELEQRVAERTAELEYSLQALDQFNKAVSHDLKAPLRRMSQLTAWLAEDGAAVLPETSKTHLAKLKERIIGMGKQLDGLRLYAQVDHATVFSKEKVDTGALIVETIELLEPPSTFTFVVQANMPVLTAHRVLLELVFKNLIENALKHHDRVEGRIEISACDLEDFIEFSVKDDGPGIEASFHERIFRIFQSLHPHNGTENTGVGLAIVKKAVESQGGTITVVSAGGEGTTFRFTWPKN